jgi:thioredoxin-like negative regulator of GroEL
MFKVLLYLWICLTIALLAAIIRYVYRWCVWLFHKRCQLTQAIQRGDTEAHVDTEEFIADEEAYIDESYRQAIDVNPIAEVMVVVEPIESMVEEDIQNAVAEIFNEDTIVASITVENEEDLQEISYDDTELDEVPTESREDSVIAEEDEIIVESIDIEEESPASTDDEINDTLDAIEEVTESTHPVNTSDAVVPQRTTYTPESSAMFVELPKDLDANRNIAQWHSRDDIVRDKFEKHIEKIRYEATVLKQRNDLLGYEKKLVEWLMLLPQDQQLQKQLADLYFQQGKFKKALSLLKKILADDPENHVALWQLGEITLHDEKIEDAYIYFMQAYTLCDDNPKYCLSLAQRYYDQEQYEQSLPLMEKLVKLRPKNIDYRVSLAHVQLKLNMRAEAKQSLLNAQEIEPMNLTLKQYLKAF